MASLGFICLAFGVVHPFKVLLDTRARRNQPSARSTSDVRGTFCLLE